ncbi:hypothetical protein HMPREF0758_3877 [Serratia odorifera DSM 4582]|uniref:Uncharacterized protein n=1 Tax=Serratia odorifera DSM 4582 TaxID=667129 RepID=D4E6S7_SEROD|nr:hypothetical protein HMPREF0758_3877 [Serratia odorifera DSM 4582]
MIAQHSTSFAGRVIRNDIGVIGFLARVVALARELCGFFRQRFALA